MTIISYTPDRREQWDKFVETHSCAWVGHYSAMFEFKNELGKDNFSLMILDEKQNVIGIMPLFLEVRKIRHLIPVRKRLVSGISLRSGPLLAEVLSEKQQSKILDLLIEHVIALGKKINVDEISINYPVIYGDKTSLAHFGFLPLKHYGFEENNIVTMLKDLDQDEQALFNSFYSNCRSKIRKCEREGGEFVIITERSEWLDCYELNLQTFKSKFVTPYSMKSMEILWDEFVVNGLAEVTAVKFNNEIVSVTLNAIKDNACYPWIGFNRKPLPISGADNLLMWKSMLHFKQKGIKFFEIGSREFSHGKQINISTFKESFSGKNIYCIGGSLAFKPFKLLGLKTIKHLILKCTSR